MLSVVIRFFGFVLSVRILALRVFQLLDEAVLVKLTVVALPNHTSPQTTRLRTDVDDEVGLSDDLLVVFHHNHSVSQLLQLTEHVDETLSVAAVETDAGFVQDIQTAHQVTA